MAFIPTKTKRIAAPAVNLFKIENFRGNDFTNEPANVSPTRSPYAPNLIRESVGKVRKRTGTVRTGVYPARINGRHILRKTDGSHRVLIHAGERLYPMGEGEVSEEQAIYTQMNDHFSTSQQMGERLWILDGRELLCYDGETVCPVRQLARVPQILIASPPAGGGTAFEQVNLLQTKRMQSFYGNGTDRVFQLASFPLDETPAVTVQVKDKNGEKVDKTEGTDFTVDYALGKVTFTTAPGKPVVEGEDNVFITFAKTVEGDAEKIGLCDVMTAYGVGGSRDRLFVTGTPRFPNQDWYCELDDPTYWGDQCYSRIGQDNSPIMGYRIIGDQLAAIKKDATDDTNVYLRRGTLVEGKTAFTASGSYQGTGALSKRAFSDLENEPLFLTRSGVYAITPSDVLGERYAQLRSRYINGRLLLEPGLENACAITWNQFYVLAVNQHLYLLDGLQFSSDKDTPFSLRQYEGYFWENVGARILWEGEDGSLCFGREDGATGRFAADYESLSSFHDMEGEAIPARWTTAEFYGKLFYNKKTFTKIAVLLGAAIATGCRIWAEADGQRELLVDYNASARYWSFSQLRFSKLSFKTDKTPQEILEKIKLNKVKKVTFIFENDQYNEPFALYSAISEFIESR